MAEPPGLAPFADLDAERSTLSEHRSRAPRLPRCSVGATRRSAAVPHLDFHKAAAATRWLKSAPGAVGRDAFLARDAHAQVRKAERNEESFNFRWKKRAGSLPAELAFDSGLATRRLDGHLLPDPAATVPLDGRGTGGHRRGEIDNAGRTAFSTEPSARRTADTTGRRRS